MRILILGGFGFIGTNILKHIDNQINSGHSVIVFDRFPVHPHGVTFKCVEKVYSGDFSDSSLINSILGSHKIDLIIHSLSTTVPVNSGNERFDIESNLIPTVELLNMMVKANIKDIVYISSGGAIYGESDNVTSHREKDEPFPKSSYGIVKLAAEKYLFQYASLYGVRPLILRASNLYGPYHYSNRQGIINTAIRSTYSGTCFTVWGNGSATKDYLFSKDFCDILFILINKKVDGKILNIGSGELLSINQILSEIKDRYPQFVWEHTTPNIFDIHNFSLDITELKKIIGEYKFTSFKEGLKNTGLWIENSR
jgi:UDP-glucose 4-epimerase